MMKVDGRGGLEVLTRRFDSGDDEEEDAAAFKWLADAKGVRVWLTTVCGIGCGRWSVRAR